MSAIVTIFNRSGAPVLDKIVDAMLDTSQFRAIDGQDRWIHSPVAMGHKHLWITPEEVGERQPLVADGGNYAVTCSPGLIIGTTCKSGSA